MKPPRIASLVPSVTELLFALGLGPCVVARTGFCTHPRDAVRTVPKVGGTKDVQLERLHALAPTHVIVNVDENRRETVDAIAAWPHAPQLVVTHPLSPDDNLALVEQLAAAFGAQPGVAAQAQRLNNSLRDELALTRPEGRVPQRVLYLIWHNPWMTVASDTYISNMLARVGWQTLPARPGGRSGADRYPVVQGDEVWLGDVEQVLLSSEPFAFRPPHLALAQALCPRARVRLVDGEMLSWYGARAVPGLRYLRQIADSEAQ